MDGLWASFGASAFLAIGVLARFDTLAHGAYVVQGYLSAIESEVASGLHSV